MSLTSENENCYRTVNVEPDTQDTAGEARTSS